MQHATKWAGLLVTHRMTEVPLNVSRKGRLAPGALCVEVAERVTCGELVDLLVDEGWGRKGAWRLVERWNGCGEW